ncbi:hypothetical protein BS47DRAFT_104051 [Hydnum rufescens UP504]|uniref:F-box domain-containing protein n=1 Tax=Hydnum rufescens UP504 TaxID=1448309 RepID=A0A9P6AQA1_9AGAM|nr:hypothetical protein BS47DRAFT_104051 [Hydnum rufescens UP504]
MGEELLIYSSTLETGDRGTQASETPIIPYDVMFSIVANADRPTLKALSLVSHDLKHMAYTYLYHAWTLVSQAVLDHRRNRLSLEKAIEFISSDERLPYVRNMRIHIWGSLGQILLYDNSEDPRAQSMIASLFSLLRRTKAAPQVP